MTNITEKMTSKTTKTILLAAILSAILIPASFIQISAISDQDNNEALEEIEEIRKVADPYIEAKRELANVKNELEILRVNGTSQEVSDAESQIQKLESDVARYLQTLHEMEQKSIAKYKIEPELEKRLRTAQQSVLDSDLPLSGVGVSGLHKALVVKIDKTQLTADKDENYYTELIQSQYSDIPIKVKFTVAIDDSCTTPTSNCDPIIGGIAMEAKNHSGCSIGLAIDRNGVEGFITAGHCVDNTSGSGDDVYQPDEDWLGGNKVGDVTVDLYQAECDCAWVDQSSEDTNTTAVWSNTNSWTSITGYTDRSTSGAYIMMHGATSTLDYGVVDDPNDTVVVQGSAIVFDVVSTTTVISQGGDSGGAITNMDEDNFHGIVKASDGSASYYIPWENISDSTNGLDL